MLLAADLQIPASLTTEELVISYSSQASQYQLLQNGTIIATASASSANNGGVRISGNAADNFLKLDVARLPAVSISMLGTGKDRLAVSDDSNITLHSDKVIVGGKTFPLTGFERIELTGGKSDNQIQIVTSTYESIQIVGGDGTDTLLGPNLASSWSILSENSGILNESIQFSGIENATGGSLKDVVRVMSAEGLTGTIDGGLGANELQGPDSESAWQILGSNSGKLNGKNFSNFGAIQGGSKADTFVFSASGQLSSKLDGGRVDPDAPSVNTIDYSTRGSAVQIDLSTTVAPGIPSVANINRFVGQGSSSRLSGPLPAKDQATWVITGANSGEVSGTAFEGFALLVGQDDYNDAFIIKPSGSVSGSITGGLRGLDGIAVENSAGELLAYQPAGSDESGSATVSSKSLVFVGLDRYEPFSGSVSQRVFTGSIFDRSVEFADADLNTTGNSSLKFQGLSFTSGSNSFSFPNPSQLLFVNLGSGADRIVNVSTDPTFSPTFIRFENGTLTADLTSGADQASLQVVSGSSNEGVVVDLSVNGMVTRVGNSRFAPTTIEVNTAAGDDTVVLGNNIPNRVKIDGGAGQDTLTGPNVDFEWVIDATNAGEMGFDGAFSNIENLTGGSAKDQFTVRNVDGVTGSITGQLQGGTGLDTLIGPEQSNQWSVQGQDSGILNTSTSFSSIENLSGGGAADSFQITNSGSISGAIDGGIDRETAPGQGPASDTIATLNDRVVLRSILVPERLAGSLVPFGLKTGSERRPTTP